MIVPRSAGRSHCETPPTLPGQPVACTRPLKNMKTRNVAKELVNPKPILKSSDNPSPPSNNTRGPHRRPMKLLMNIPIMYASRKAVQICAVSPSSHRRSLAMVVLQIVNAFRVR